MHLLGKKIKYPNLRSAMRPVPHSDDLPVPTPPVNKDLLSSSDEEMPSREDSAESISLEDIESTYSGTSGNEPHWITQEDLNDLARDLYLSKQQSELLASTKMRLFKSQKTRGDRAKLFINLNSAHPN